jgi:hypothetical protein
MNKTSHPRAGKPTRWALIRQSDGWMVATSLATFVPPTGRPGVWRTRREALAYGRLSGLGDVRAVKLP